MSWTVVQERDVEMQISEAASQLAVAIETELPRQELRVAAVIGGYGRGEGGVVRRDEGFRPHNNIDLLIVSAGRKRLSPMCETALRQASAQIAERCGIPVDVGCVTEHQLDSSRPRVMWYDVRYGHKVLVGDASFLSGLVRYRADNIPVDDIVDLMTNRGALAVIANELVSVAAPSRWAVQHAMKGTMKAIVGYGDALLWQRGLYHVSYQEKARSMQAACWLDEGLKALYAEAVDFRFAPDYQRYAGRESDWVRAATDKLESMHQDFAAEQFDRAIGWKEYPEAVMRLCLKSRGTRAWVSHVRAEARNYWEHRDARSERETWLERISLRRHRLAAALPKALYGSKSSQRREFIVSWARECDVNFPEQLRLELGLGESQ